MPIERVTEWGRLRKELARRLSEPAGRVVFVIYFIGVVVILGGMGWMIPVCRLFLADDRSVVSELPSALSTFFLALLAGAMADIVLEDNSESGNAPSNNASTKGFRVFALGLSLVGVPLAYGGIQRSQLIWSYVSSILGMLISLFLWWVLNADKAKWRDEPIPPISAAGGTTSVELKGSTAGLTS